MKTLYLKRNDSKVVICLTGKNPQRHYEQVLKPRGFEPCTQVEYNTIRKEIAEREVCPTPRAPDVAKACIEAAITMNNTLGDMYNIETPKHIQFVSWEDVRVRTAWYPKKIMKVTIEWVDESEADPKNFETA